MQNNKTKQDKINKKMTWQYSEDLTNLRFFTQTKSSLSNPV